MQGTVLTVPGPCGKCVLRFPSQILLALLPQFSLLPRGIEYDIIKNNCADLCPCGQSAETSEILNASLGMRILGLYLGTVLLMISLTVLALQQLTDSIEHKQRFNILRKLGIEEGEINKIVLKQIGIYFAIPVTIGVIGFVVFIYNYYHIFETQMSSYVGDKMFILNMIIGIVLMIIVYVSYFLGTYYTFKRNIKN